ncbi:TMEM175 family protein [Actinoplanes sp. NPDC051475]|uniref:TMEM175 family protein n=1 Tax=Actinoplanes sp. NPDC051475 TaxID=3157225 RepID=UPI00344C8225
MVEKTHGLERMIFFSDAVIAIMLTLLALELPVPEAEDPQHLWHALAAHNSQYLAFLISFSVIAVTWVAHHMLFTHVSRTDPPLITLNVLTLFAYALVPWASKTLGDVANGAGVVVYAAAMTLLGFTMFLVVRHVVRSGLLEPQAPAEIVKGVQAWSVATAIMFGVSIPAAFVIGRWTMIVWPFGYLSLRLVAEYHSRRNRKAATAS